MEDLLCHLHHGILDIHGVGRQAKRVIEGIFGYRSFGSGSCVLNPRLSRDGVLTGTSCEGGNLWQRTRDQRLSLHSFADNTGWWDSWFSRKRLFQPLELVSNKCCTCTRPWPQFIYLVNCRIKPSALSFFFLLPYILYIVYSTHLWRFQAVVTII